MEILVFVIIGFVALIIVLTIVGMIVHLAMFGSLFGLVTNRIAAQIKSDQNAAKAVEPVACMYCQGMIPANEGQCPDCGAKR